MTPSPYERAAWARIQEFKAERAEGGAETSRRARRWLAGRGETLAGKVVEAVLPPLTQAVSDVAHWRIDPGATRRLQRAGAPVASPADIWWQDLAVVDRAAAGIRRRYVGSLTVEGATAGAFGAAGMVVELPVLVTVNLRAIGAYGTTYGFDLERVDERLWATQVLVLAAGNAQTVRAAAMVNLHQIGMGIAKGLPLRELDQYVLVPLVRRVAQMLGVQLTRRGLTRLLPIIGAAASAAANAKLAASVCEAAEHLYRERFLLRKYGPQTWGVEPDLSGNGLVPGPDGPFVLGTAGRLRGLGSGAT